MRFCLSLFLALTIEVPLVAQEITLEKNTVDDFTGKMIRVTNLIRVGKSDRNSYVWARASRIVDNGSDLSFLTFKIRSDLGCLSEYEGYVMIKSGDDIISLPQGSSTDCGKYLVGRIRQYSASYHFVDAKGPKELERLYATVTDFEVAKKKVEELFTTKLVEKIRIYGTEYYLDFDIEDPFIFQKLLRTVK